MRTKDKSRPKTLGPRAAELVATLHERGRLVFTLADVADITGLGEASARSFVRKLVGRGVASRLRSGLYNLVPFELGREREYLGNPYVVARELMGGKAYYLSHASAMDIHGMVTQPQLVVFVTSPAPMRGRTILGTEFRFVRCKPSDVDGLKQPEHCGGLTEVAKGLWMRRADVSAKKLVEYALRLGVGAVMHRLGYLVEAYGIGAPEDLAPLRENLTSTYNLLDPVLPAEGKFLARWRLRLNVSTEEIQAVVRT